MVELIHKRGWDSKVFDTGRTQLNIDGVTEQPIYGTKLQNGLHDIEPDRSFVECDMTIDTIANGVTTHQVKRGRYGELRFGDTSSVNKHLCKIKYKDGNGISLKYLGADSGSPIINGDVKFAAADGIQLRHLPTYKGVKIELITNDPLVASLEYAFSIKTYGQNYTYEITNGSIIATGEDGKTITIHAPYAIDANDDTGQVHYELLDIVEGYQVFKKVVDEAWFRQAAAPVRIDPDVTIDDDSGTLIDTLLYSLSPNNNYGILSEGQCLYRIGDRANELVKVDLSGLSGTVISGYFGFDVYAGTPPVTIEWNRVLKVWIEGTKNGAAADNGEPTWISQAHNEDVWAAAGCLGDGTDRQAIAEGSKAITAFGSDQQLAMTTTTMQAWLDNSADNHGIVISAPNLVDGKYVQWRSSEATSGEKPYFYMEYTEDNGGGLLFFFGQRGHD